ncbi:hypothetical protein [Magnetospirillum sp. ME-1]|uniref:hypothetical protein n=1 Tax=Magnetospirillum sp. ME-1 TaxID=1639348 RepID=UPI0011AE48D9|nr:hypothetical protein [Magnetospirillum sp. ME-1]
MTTSSATSPIKTKPSQYEEAKSHPALTDLVKLLARQTVAAWVANPDSGEITKRLMMAVTIVSAAILLH